MRALPFVNTRSIFNQLSDPAHKTRLSSLQKPLGLYHTYLQTYHPSINMPPKPGPPHKHRDTHFLNFPLITQASVPQLAKSLAYFREVTTSPPRNRRDPAENLIGNKESEDATSVSPERNQLEAADDEAESETETESKQENSTPPKDPLKIVPFKAHRPPGTFHLTLGTMDLTDPERMEEALKLLQEIDYSAILSDVEKDVKTPRVPDQSSHSDSGEGASTSTSNTQETVQSLLRAVSPPSISRSEERKPPDRLSITLQGMDAFSSAKNARVLYANPLDSTHRLYAFGVAIQQKFRDAGFVTETRALVLHATIANTLYVSSSQKRHGRGGRRFHRPLTIDAREIVRIFNGALDGDNSQSENIEPFVWAKDVVIDRVRICKMGATKTDNEVLGMEYKPLGEALIFSP